MRQGFFLILALVFWLFSAIGHAEERSWNGSWDLRILTTILERVPSGRLSLARAKAKDSNFFHRLRVGDVSVTENTYSRSYSLLDGQEEVRQEELISVSRHLSRAEAVVDLAHELTHFAWKRFPSPYHMELSREEFIRRGIEEQGGELDAFMVECKVAWELEAKDPSFPVYPLCNRYRRGNDDFDREQARRDYYALGEAWAKLDPRMRRAFPESSAAAPVFTSSYAHLPYPIALAKEYEETKRSACQNNEKKYKLIAAQGGGRTPASTTLQSEIEKLARYQKEFCSSP